MGTNTILKLLSAVLVLAIIAMIVVEKNSQLNWNTLPDDLRRWVEQGIADLGREATESTVDDGEREVSRPAARPDVQTPSPNDSGAQASLTDPGQRNRLVVGMMGSTPMLSQIHSISDVPWQDAQVNRAFNQSKAFACELLLPDAAVKPPLVRQPSGRRGVMGRLAAVSVGLEIDRSADLKLPSASAGEIRRYLADHRLVIQPMIYQDEQGNAYLGTDCRAAFFRNDQPTSTIKAEPLIEEAIGKFRSIGLLRHGNTGDGRTLVMAFRYVDSATTDGPIASRPQEVTELLFLHLIDSSSEKLPRLEVFATTNSRQSLHRLVTDAESVIQDPLPGISASIRFDDFVLLGLYPAKPVVTGIRLRSSGVISLDTILKLTQSGASEDRITFQNLLDQFTTITSGYTARPL